MHANVGDRILIGGRKVGQPQRNCEVLEVRRPTGEPPYVVRWADTGHEDLFFPGSDARVVSEERSSAG